MQILNIPTVGTIKFIMAVEFVERHITAVRSSVIFTMIKYIQYIGAQDSFVSKL